MRYLILPLAMLVAACEQPASESPSNVADAPEQQAEEEPAGTTSLAGTWRVAEIDGEPQEAIPQIELSATSRLIYAPPTCAGMERRYVIDGEVFSRPE